MKVAGAVVRGVSIMYATTVGNEEATASVIMAPDADQVNISICPGVSRMIWLQQCQTPMRESKKSITRLPPLYSPSALEPGRIWW